MRQDQKRNFCESRVKAILPSSSISTSLNITFEFWIRLQLPQQQQPTNLIGAGFV